MADSEPAEDVSNASDSSENESDDSEAVELLVTGRERRKTAGNRYDRDMVLEEADGDEEPDEVTLLFAAAENEEDEEFKSEASHGDDMSSSDDDDQGPNAGAENLEGEQELQKQAKQARAKKRKADLALTTTAGLRKKPKFDPTQPKPIMKKPTKKKDRVTWLPTEDTSAARSSLRKQTIIHREETLQRLKESEAQSKKLKILKAKRDKERAKDAPKAMTQTDRLAEAERVERRNAKSLNRWEATEKKRVEEQAAKLAALKNRKLEGPIVTLWSGKAFYRGPRPGQLWKEPGEDVPGEPKKRGRKPKGYHEHMAALRAAGDSIPVSAQQSPKPPPSTEPLPHQTHSTSSDATPHPQVTITQPEGSGGFFLSGIHEYASMQLDATGKSNTNTVTPVATVEESLMPLNDTKMVDASEPDSKEGTAHTLELAPSIEGSEGVIAPGNGPQPKADHQTIPVDRPLITEVPLHDPSTNQISISNQPGFQASTQPLSSSTTLPYPPSLTDSAVHTPIQPLPPPPSQPIEEGYTTKNLVILNKFDDLPEKDRHDYGLFYNSRKSVKPVKHNLELCPITTQPARYRDPKTGIGYANMFAYKVLQELSEHKFTWSSMLGCYVGREAMPVARGVPEGFFGR